MWTNYRTRVPASNSITKSSSIKVRDGSFGVHSVREEDCLGAFGRSEWDVVRSHRATATIHRCRAKNRMAASTTISKTEGDASNSISNSEGDASNSISSIRRIGNAPTRKHAAASSLLPPAAKTGRDGA